MTAKTIRLQAAITVDEDDLKAIAGMPTICESSKSSSICRADLEDDRLLEGDQSSLADFKAFVWPLKVASRS